MRRIKVIVFDMGGTLMEYVGMPLSWSKDYPRGFQALAMYVGLDSSDERIALAAERLKACNPRLTHRETEIPAEEIFANVLKDWNLTISVAECISVFWRGMALKSQIYPEAEDALRKLRGRGYRIAVLTDLPNGMPDAIFRKEIIDLEPYIDEYVSSAVAGFRKPNRTGLTMIAKRFSIPAEEMLFVGDEVKDQQTAEKFGCSFFRMDRQAGGLQKLIDILQ